MGCTVCGGSRSKQEQFLIYINNIAITIKDCKINQYFFFKTICSWGSYLLLAEWLDVPFKHLVSNCLCCILTYNTDIAENCFNSPKVTAWLPFYLWKIWQCCWLDHFPKFFASFKFDVKYENFHKQANFDFHELFEIESHQILSY